MSPLEVGRADDISFSEEIDEEIEGLSEEELIDFIFESSE